MSFFEVDTQLLHEGLFCSTVTEKYCVFGLELRLVFSSTVGPAIFTDNDHCISYNNILSVIFCATKRCECPWEMCVESASSNRFSHLFPKANHVKWGHANKCLEHVPTLPYKGACDRGIILDTVRNPFQQAKSRKLGILRLQHTPINILP